nr:ATP-grasp domain-containing protein [Gammaproteobacteria bacterium]
FNGSIDGIMGYIDFPVSVMVPLLNEKFGLSSISIDHSIQCEHKYWSRLSQRASIPEYIPAFSLFDPFDAISYDNIPLSYPFWIKPVKSYSSHLGFKISSKADLEHALPIIRKNIYRITRPFDQLLTQLSLDMPDEVRSVSGYHFLAEELLSGHQCTLEGSMQSGQFYVHGVIDSPCYPNSSAFSAYQYPSIVPEAVQQEMANISKRFLESIGFDNAAFNIDFFWDKTKNTLRLVEVNPRVSVVYSALFHQVEGISNHQIALNLALGRLPKIEKQCEDFDVAAVFFYRVFQNAEVEAIPNEAEIAAIEAAIPGTKIQLEVTPGMYLSDLPEQDSYSYLVSRIFMGAANQKALLNHYHACLEKLNRYLKLRKVA